MKLFLLLSCWYFRYLWVFIRKKALVPASSKRPPTPARNGSESSQEISMSISSKWRVHSRGTKKPTSQRETFHVKTVKYILSGKRNYPHHSNSQKLPKTVNTFCVINKQWEVIALKQLTSHMTMNTSPQQQRPESPTITPPGITPLFVYVWINFSQPVIQNSVERSNAFSCDVTVTKQQKSEQMKTTSSKNHSCYRATAKAMLNTCRCC